MLNTTSHYLTLLHTTSHYFTLLHTTSHYFTLLHTDFTLLHTTSHHFTLKHTLASLKTPAKHKGNKGPGTNEGGGTSGPKQKDTRPKVTSDHTQDAPEHFR